MSRNRSSNETQILLFYLAVGVFIILTGAYFLLEGMQDQNLKEFLQGVSGNVIATVISFIIVYLFLSKNNISLGGNDSSSQILNETADILDELSRLSVIKSDINSIKDAVSFHDDLGDIDKSRNKNWLWNAYREELNADIKKTNSTLRKCLGMIEAIMQESVNSSQFKERYRLNEENTSLKVEIASLNGTLQNLRSTLQGKEEEIARKNAELSTKNDELLRKDEDLRRKDREIREKDKEIRDMNENLSSLKREMSNLTSTMNSFTTGFAADFANMNAKVVSTIGNSSVNQDLVLQQLKINTSRQLQQFEGSTSFQLSKITHLLERSSKNQ